LSSSETLDVLLAVLITVSELDGAIPPPLPPSVEEAYRKKCIELRRRMNEVEEHNDAR
jgi:hypothetical protein